MLGTDAFQETNFVGITQAVTKWNCQVKRTEDIPGAIAKAFYIARSGRPGPVVVDITKDAQCGDGPVPLRKADVHPQLRPRTRARRGVASPRRYG